MGGGVPSSSNTRNEQSVDDHEASKDVSLGRWPGRLLQSQIRCLGGDSL